MSAPPALQPLISAPRLRARIEELGAEIARLYGDDDSLVLIGVLKGSTFFMADLVRATPIDVTIDFMSISNYSDLGAQPGVVRILKDVEQNLSGRDVLLVEDIVDTGLTLAYLRKVIGGRGARSVRTVSLLDRATRRIVPVPLEMRGFEIPDVFVVGYGLDFHGIYRNLPQIFAVDDLNHLVADPTSLVAPLFGYAN